MQSGKKKEQEKKPRKIAIVGTSKTTRDMAPFDDESWEIWTLGNNYKWAPRCNLHFEMHDFPAGKKRWVQEYIRWLRKPTCPLMAQKQTIDCPTAQEYPLAAIRGKWGEYFTCSFSYMIAYAIEAGATDILICGAELAQDSEYAYQRPSVEYWVGICRGLGINVAIPEISDLCKSAQLYGYETAGGGSAQMNQFMKCNLARTDELAKRSDLIQQEIAAKNHELHVLSGALENLRWSRQWFPVRFQGDGEQSHVDTVDENTQGPRGR